jgi:ribosomal protein L37E
MDETAGEAVDRRYQEWRCTACGHAHPKNHPPCDRCGNMSFELVEVDGEDFDAELRGTSYLQILRENWVLASVAFLVVAVAGVAVLTSSGLFVLSDPFGLGIRYGVVDAAEPDGDGQSSAAEFRGRLAGDVDVETLRWSGRELQLVYETRASSNAELREELGTVGERYAEYVANGGDGERLRVRVVSGGGGTVARVTVERDWAADFAAGRLSEAEYRARILGE